jgi:hypothetical protein
MLLTSGEKESVNDCSEANVLVGLVKKSFAFVKLDDSLLCSQKLMTLLRPKAAELSPQYFFPSSLRYILIYFPSTPRSPKWFLPFRFYG